MFIGSLWTAHGSNASGRRGEMMEHRGEMMQKEDERMQKK